MRAGGASGGSGDPADTLAPHFIGGNCEISSSATCRGPYSGPWMVFTFHLHSLALSLRLHPLHVSHTCLCQMSRPGEVGGGKAGQGQWAGGRRRKVILAALGPFGEMFSGRMASGDTPSFKPHHPPPTPLPPGKHLIIQRIL